MDSPRPRRRSQRLTRPTVDAREVLDREAPRPSPYFRGGSKPYTRQWWLAGPFRREDIRHQLAWLRSAGSGGVDFARLWPSWMDDGEPRDRPARAGMVSLVAFTRREAGRPGLG